jgi:hypothetical protein
MTTLPSRVNGKRSNLADHLKRYYRLARWLLYRKPYVYKTSFAIRRIDLTARNSFFGYYDKSPLNSAQNFIVYHTADSDTKKNPTFEIPIRIVVRDRSSGEVIANLESRAYNWQQGTRIQWISENKFIYNYYDSDNDRYISKIHNVVNRNVVETLPSSVYDCFNDEFALTLNFRRLARLAPDYGYFCHTKDVDLDEIFNDGVWRLDMRKGTSKLVLSLAQAIDLAPSPEMKGAKHSVNHIMISPDGERFIVIHRWYKYGRRHDRLLVARTDGSELKLLADGGMVSHCFWQSNSCLLSYLRHDGKDGYYTFDVFDPHFTSLGNGVVAGFGDGHPNMLGAQIVFDTYPDRARMQQLFLLDVQQRQLQRLGEFFEPLGFHGVTRCDLHPRFDRLGGCVFFDSAHDGTRQLYEMTLGGVEP